MIPTIIDIGIIAITVATMLAIGLELRSDGLRSIGQAWRNLLVPLGLLLTLPPLVGLGCVMWIQPSPTVAAAILLISACPIGDIANLYTLLARGNPALSLFLSSITCILAPFSMALMLPLASRLSGYDEAFGTPGLELVSRLALFIALPVVVGVIWRHHQEKAIRFSSRLQSLSTALIAAVIVLVFIDQRKELAAFGWEAAGNGLIYILSTLGIGLIIVRLLRLPPESASVVALCFPVRNIAITGVVAVGIMGRLDYAAVGATYFMVEVPVLLAFSHCIRRWNDRGNPGSSSQQMNRERSSGDRHG